jgi:hypothetical protein
MAMAKKGWQLVVRKGKKAAAGMSTHHEHGS